MFPFLPCSQYIIYKVCPENNSKSLVYYLSAILPYIIPYRKGAAYQELYNASLYKTWTTGCGWNNMRERQKDTAERKDWRYLLCNTCCCGGSVSWKANSGPGVRAQREDVTRLQAWALKQCSNTGLSVSLPALHSARTRGGCDHKPTLTGWNAYPAHYRQN